MELDKYWISRFVDGEPEAEAGILKIALSHKYQREYTDLKTVCKAAGLSQIETETIRRWKQHGTEADSNIISRLLAFIEFEEPERYNQALFHYYINNK